MNTKHSIKILSITFTLLTFLCSTPTYAFVLYGHRGARGLSPENTIPSYKSALKIGVDYVDMDVAMTKDHVVVVQHDLALNPDITRDQHGHWIKRTSLLIKNLTLKQLQQYDVGRIKPGTKYASYFPHQQPRDHTPIPTLKAVIDFVKAHAGNNVGFQIEIKTDPHNPKLTYTPEEMAAAVAKIIQAEGIAKRTQVQAFDWRCLLALQKIAPSIATAYLTDTDLEKNMSSSRPSTAGLFTAGKLLKDYHHSIPQMVKALGGKYWDPQDTEVSLEQIQEAHQLGLKVIVWSAPDTSQKDVDEELIKKVIAMGVDGVITDRPDVVKKYQSQSNNN